MFILYNILLSILFTIYMQMMKGCILMDFKYEISKAISNAAGIDENEILKAIEIPPNSDMGDYAFPCFKLAKTFRKAPPAIAAEICGKIEK